MSYILGIYNINDVALGIYIICVIDYIHRQIASHTLGEMNAKGLTPFLLAVLLTCLVFAANCSTFSPHHSTGTFEENCDEMKCSDCMQATRVATWRYRLVVSGERRTEGRWSGAARYTSYCV